MEKEFDNLSTYITLAKKIISKFAPNFYSSLRKELLNNEDAIADIASALMFADWRWDENRKGFNGKSKTKYSYRNQCGIWAIKTYMTNKYKKNNQSYSLYNPEGDTDSTFAENISDNIEYDPSKIVEEKEYAENLSTNIKELLSSGIISDKQKDQIVEYYFNEKTLSDIGKQFGVTREAVRQNIQKGLSKIREYV
ncbi:MAG: sigma-70 family RNA polymerase sigma factor [Candidatus Paceibacterota bacterium]